MKRREFIVLVGATLTQVARAHASERVARVGFLESGSLAARQHLLKAFRQGLRERGYLEGESVVVEARWGNGKVSDLPVLVDELLRAKVDVLLAGTTVAALAAAKRTKTLPIVFAVPADPVGVGLAASLRRPGGNATGLTTGNIEIVPRRLELLKEIAGPRANRAGVLYNPKDASNALLVRSAQEAAPKLGFVVREYMVQKAEEFEGVFSGLAGAVDVLLVSAGALTDSHTRRLAELAAAVRIPAMYGSAEFVVAGGLISYAANFSDNYRRAAAYVDKILKGESPAELAIEQASRFELVVNRRAAKALGLTIPQSILLRADRVIE